MMGIVVKNT